MKWRRLLYPFTCLVLLAALLSACSGGEDVDLAPSPPEGHELVTLEVTSTAFTAGEAIPAEYTHDGANISPPLQWDEPPEGTASFALVVDDPDSSGGTWIHWLVFNLPAESQGLDEGVTSTAGLPSGALQGKNTWGNTKYEGPNPPSGTHHYYIRVYALDKTLDLETGIKSKDLVRAMEGHVLGYGELMGTCSH